jgi:NADH:ubiquinone oxidoreductase subunit B-like Fe-S oxidoreductase
VLGPVEKVVPVNFYIPGCPPRPEAIIYGVALALGLVPKKIVETRLKQPEMPIPRYHPQDLRREGDLTVYEHLEKV